MKRISLSLGILACILSGNATSVFAQWSAVGAHGFSDGGTSFNSLAIDKLNTPFVAYTDLANGNKATVKTFDGTQWTVAGTPAFSAGSVKDVCIAVAADGTPYVAYSDRAYGYKLVVQQYNGKEWLPVGNPGFTAGRANYVSFALDGNNTPYVAFSDESRNNGLTVMKYDGRQWTTVGTSNISAGQAIGIDLAIDNTGTPYVVYKDISIGGATRVVKYSHNNWITVGVPGLGWNISANYTTITLDDKGTPYVTYATEYAGRERLLRYDGNNWITVASGFAAGAVQQPSLVTGKNGTIYLAYTDAGRGGKVSIATYDGNNIQVIPVDGSKGDYPVAAISPEGSLYVSLREQNTALTEKATLYRYSSTKVQAVTSQGNIAIFPNPATTQLSVQAGENMSSIYVVDMAGCIAKAPVHVQGRAATIDVSELRTGYYLLKAVGADGKICVSRFQKL